MDTNEKQLINTKLGQIEVLVAEVRGLLSSPAVTEVKPPVAVEVTPVLPAVTSPGPVRRPKLSAQDRVEGVFTGREVLTEFDETVPVPVGFIVANALTVGDKLRLDYSGGGEEPLIKVVEKIKRRGIEGVLKYDNNIWRVETREGKYQVLPEFVSLYSLKEGERVSVFLPRSYKGKIHFAVAEKYRDLTPTEKDRDRGRFREGGERRDDRRDREDRRDDRGRDVRPRRDDSARESASGEEPVHPDDLGRMLEEDDLR